LTYSPKETLVMFWLELVRTKIQVLTQKE